MKGINFCFILRIPGGFVSVFCTDANVITQIIK